MKKYIKKNALIIVLSCIFLFSLFKMTVFLIEITRNKNMNKDLIKDVIKIEKTIVNNEEVEEFAVDFESLSNMNKDVRGWIRFNHDKVNYPIVQTTDNSYYLNHTFHKKKNSLGTIFMDYRNQSWEDKNVVLFGHNSTDGSMFGSLRDTLEDNFFDNEENRIIEIIDVNNNIYYYEIFSVYTIIKEEYYITTNFDSNIEYMEFLNTIKKRSIRDFNINLSENDKILTLSTCNGVGGTNKRLVIHARLKDN